MASKRHRKKLKRQHIHNKIVDYFEKMEWKPIQYTTVELVVDKIMLSSPIERIYIEGVVLDCNGDNQKK